MLTERLTRKISKYKAQKLDRQRKSLERHNNIIFSDNKSTIDFSSNDYLSLKSHPEIIKSLKYGAEKYGVGSGSSPLISGYSSAHQSLEKSFAQWLNVDKAVLFNSGYSANISIIRALSKRSDIIFSDKYCHASLLDGIQLSRARHVRYRHNDLDHIDFLACQKKPDFMITESVFSMEGDISPISDISNISKKYNSGLIIDDAHGVGILGNMGKGIIEHSQLSQKDFSCLVAPLGKAFGIMGAIVAGRDEIIESILQFSKSYMYSTAISPAICLALQKSLEIIQQEHWRREQLKNNIQYFINYAIETGLNLIHHHLTPIQPILIGCHQKVIKLQNYLLSNGFYTSAIRPPTVPKQTSRIRISLNALHTRAQITQLIDSISRGLKQCEII